MSVYRPQGCPRAPRLSSPECALRRCSPLVLADIGVDGHRRSPGERLPQEQCFSAGYELVVRAVRAETARIQPWTFLPRRIPKAVTFDPVGCKSPSGIRNSNPGFQVDR